MLKGHNFEYGYISLATQTKAAKIITTSYSQGWRGRYGLYDLKKYTKIIS